MRKLWFYRIWICATAWGTLNALTAPEQMDSESDLTTISSKEPEATLPAGHSTQTIRWDQPVAQDPKTITFTLKNGFRCYILPTTPEKPFASLRLLIHAGAAMETPEEDGIAHFIEHMTFNGSEHFKPGTLLNYFRDNGMSFGGDTNAFTGYSYTCYQIDLPKADETSINDGLLVLKDQSTGCLFLQSEIDRERGVILSEMRTRDSAKYRAYKQLAAFLYPNSLFSKRFILGTEATIHRFKSQDFFSFYKKWYTPSRMALIITGPVDPSKVRKWVERLFAPLKSAPAVEDPDFGCIEHAKGLQIKVIKDAELPQATLSFIAQKPIQRREYITAQYLRDQFAWSLIRIILTQRLDLLKEKTPISGFHVKYEIEEDAFEGCEIEIKCQPKDALSLIKTLEQFHRYVSTFAFSQKEIDSAKNILEGRFKIACTREANKTPKEMAIALVRKLMEEHQVLSAEQILEHFQKFSIHITPELCTKLWNDLWQTGTYVVLTGPFGNEMEEAIVRKTVLESRETVLTWKPMAENPELKSPFKNQTKANVADRSSDEKLGVECLRFSNNVRVNLKPTDFEKDRILIYVSLGNGRISNKKALYPGLDLLLSSSFAAGGLQQCSICDLNRILDGKMINIDFDVEDNCYAFKCLTNRECFKTQMELVCAYMLEPGYRDEGVQNFQKVLPTKYEQFANTPEGVLTEQGTRFLTCNDDRFGYPPYAVLNQRNFSEGREVLTPVFQHEYMEITIVGDFDRDLLVQDLRETVGKLTLRAAQKREQKANTIVKWPKAQTKMFTCNSELERAIVSIVWPVKNLKFPQEQWAFRLLCDILGNRLIDEIRQANGDTYSPHVSGNIKEVFQSHSSISCLLLVAPEKVDDITDQILNIADTIAKQGVTPDELDRAKNPRITRITKIVKENSFWLHWLQGIQAHPEKATWDLANTQAYAAVTPKAVQLLAKKYLRRNSALCLQIRPNKKEGKSHDAVSGK